jgi:hypothetical protein
MAKWGWIAVASRHVSVGDLVGVEHRFGSQPAGRDRDRGAAVRGQLVTERERHAVHCGLHEVVEERHAVVGRVVLVGAVPENHELPAFLAQ